MRCLHSFLNGLVSAASGTLSIWKLEMFCTDTFLVLCGFLYAGREIETVWDQLAAQEARQKAKTVVHGNMEP